MKKTKGKKLIQKWNKVKDKVRQGYAIGTKVKYVGEYKDKYKNQVFTIIRQDIQNIENVVLVMDREGTYVNIGDLEIISWQSKIKK